jgi:xanthine dehydrogenase accessory factor
VHAPAGLNIGAVTPAEIALSILAQMTEVKRQISTQAAQSAAS